MKPIVSVIVTNYNGKQFLKDCFVSLLKETNGPYEILFIDDFSTDGSFEYVKKLYGRHKKFRIFQNPENLGPGKSINRMVRESHGKYLFFLNNDTVTEPGWYKHIVHAFGTYKKAAVLQGKILRAGTKNYDYAGDFMGPFGFLIERAQGAVDTGQFDRVDRVFSIKGTCMIVRKDILNKIGGFDEMYKFGIEETDVTWRCWLAGYETLFYPYITVFHYFGTARKGKKYYVNARIHYEGCKNMIAMHIKNLGPKNMILMLPVHITCWFVLACASLVRLDRYKSSALFKGLFWNLTHFPMVLKKRKFVQKTRVISDDDLFKIVGAKREPSYYVKKGVSYLTGKPY